jgi:hypothetical protein
LYLVSSGVNYKKKIDPDAGISSFKKKEREKNKSRKGVTEIRNGDFFGA